MRGSLPGGQHLELEEMLSADFSTLIKTSRSNAATKAYLACLVTRVQHRRPRLHRTTKRLRVVVEEKVEKNCPVLKAIALPPTRTQESDTVS